VTVEVVDATWFSFLKILNTFPFFVKETTVRVFNEMTEADELNIGAPFTVI